MASMLAENAWIIGWAIVAVVAGYAILTLIATAGRVLHARQVSSRELAVLDERLAAARALHRERKAEADAWNGFRKFEVASKVDEGGHICSLYLRPHDGKPLPGYRPGQYLTFRFPVPGEKNPLVRCYSLSDRAREDHYRVSIKRLPGRDDAPPGRASNYVHDDLREGDILDVKAPSGHFHLDPASSHPIVLIGGGVGITPVLSMLNTVAEEPTPRETWFFYGVRNRPEHIMREHLAALAASRDNLHINVCYSDPDSDDEAGVHFDHAERVSVDLFKRLLPSNNYDFYICGPPGMMAALTGDLETWGVPKSRIHFEAFGPATVKRSPPPEADATTSAVTAEITFSRSGRTVPWEADCDSLLEFAERHDIVIDAGCRAGNCGTCLTAIKSGEVTYRTEPGAEPETGSCLTCVCVPKGPLVLDA